MLNDYIRRSDVLKLFDEWGGGCAYIEVETDGAIRAVNDLLSVKPVGCDGCVHNIFRRFRVCDVCSRAYLDRYIKYIEVK